MRRPATGGGERARCVEPRPMHTFSLSRRAAAGAGTMSATDEAEQSRALSAPAFRLGEPARRIGRGWLVRRALLAADATGLLAAFFLTELLFLHDPLVGGIGTTLESAIFVALLPVWLVG